MCACLRDVAHHQRHFSCLISGFKRASFSFPFSFRRPDVSSSKTPKCCCFHRPVNRLPLRSLFSVSALRFSCEKTQSGFLVIEHVCVELNLCECDVVPRRRRRRRGMENVNSTVVWQEQTWWPTADSPMFLLWSRYLASLSVFTHPPPPPSLHPHPPPPASPDQLYQHDKSSGKTRVSSLLPVHLSEVFYFLTRVLGITETLFAFRRKHTLHSFPQSYLQTLPGFHPINPKDLTASG